MGKSPPSVKDMTVVEILDFFKSKLDNRGRMYIPKEAREKLAIRPGDKIYLKIEKHHLIAYTAKAIEQLNQSTQ